MLYDILDECSTACGNSSRAVKTKNASIAVPMCYMIYLTNAAQHVVIVHG